MQVCLLFITTDRQRKIFNLVLSDNFACLVKSKYFQRSIKRM
jgi:hypothetical protein